HHAVSSLARFVLHQDMQTVLRCHIVAFEGSAGSLTRIYGTPHAGSGGDGAAGAKAFSRHDNPPDGAISGLLLDSRSPRSAPQLLRATHFTKPCIVTIA